jgi:hypothetical protein
MMLEFIETIKEHLQISNSRMDDNGIQEIILQNMSREQISGPLIRLNIGDWE